MEPRQPSDAHELVQMVKQKRLRRKQRRKGVRRPPTRDLRNSQPLGRGRWASRGPTAGRAGTQVLSVRGGPGPPLLCGRPLGSWALDNGGGVAATGTPTPTPRLRPWLGNNTHTDGPQDLHSDVWGVDMALFLSGDRFVQCRWRRFCS